MNEQSSKQKRILVVDDEKYILLIIKFNLKKYNYEVVTANNGEEALQIAPEIKPDLIILDIMMPGMNGFDVCRKLKNNKETAHIPVIFLTGRGIDTDKTKAKELGVAKYITKPFSVPYLISVLQETFNSGMVK